MSLLMAMASSLNIKELQTNIIRRLIKLPSDASTAASTSSATSLASSASSSSPAVFSGVWKILIYDSYCQDILSPLLSVNALRELGITLHLHINSTDRDAIPDVPAIYFMRSTAENIEKLALDINKGLYQQYYVNFSNYIPRPLLESLANQTVSSPNNGKIAKLLDQYTEFICLEQNLITFNHKNSFISLNNPKQTEAALFAYLDQTVENLFCLLITVGIVPIIRAKPGGAAEILANKLDQKLREHLMSRNNLFTNQIAQNLSFHRPLLVISERIHDISTALAHPWTYQALLNDLLQLEANRITISEENNTSNGAKLSQSAKKSPKTYDLNSSEDKFWRSNAGNPFPKVAEAVQTKLEAYQAQVNAINKKNTSGTGEFVDPTAVEATTDLSKAISQLPKLQRKKRLLDQHVNMASSLLNCIRNRDIDAFYELEQGFLTKSGLNQQELLKLIGDPSQNNKELQQSKGNLIDRVRALAIYYLQNPEADESQLNFFRNLIETSANSANSPHSNEKLAELEYLSALNYLKQYKFEHRVSSGQASVNLSNSAGDSAQGSANSTFSSMFGRLAEGVATYTGGVISGVRNLLPSNTDCPLTRAVDSLVSGKDSSESENFLYFDPKSAKKGSSKFSGPSAATSGASFKDIIVFVAGPGCYSEYENLQQIKKKHSNNIAINNVNSVVYCCSQLCSPVQFLQQLKMLGSGNTATLPVD
jgi:hypothetical protein